MITGEGRSDRQTLMGKLPQRILEHVASGTCRDGEGAAAPLDGGKPDVGEGECAAERCCHPGF